jgi:hypothetical protein
LTILGPGTISLPKLSILDGDLIINSSSEVVNFAADALYKIYGQSYSFGINVDSPPKLESLSFKNLSFISGQVYIAGAPALTNVNMPALVNVTQRVFVAQTGLQSFSLPSLKYTFYPSKSGYTYLTYFWARDNPLGNEDGISISSNRNLSQVEFPALDILMGTFEVYDNKFLRNLTVPNLTRIGSGSIRLNGSFE